ncbi:MAG: HAD family phosphatase [Bacillota bacterium]
MQWLRKKFVFDMDGVLIDSEGLHFETTKRVCACQGYLLSRAEYDRHVGRPSAAMWSEWISHFGWQRSVNSLIVKELEEQNCLLEQEGWKVPLVPGVREFLSFCKSSNITMAVASSASASFIKKMLCEHEISGYFDAVVSTESVKHGKPHPDVFVYVAGCLRATVSECVVIEDSSNGVQAAKNAGMITVGFINPNSGQQDFSSADVIVDDYKTLQAMMRELEPCE